MYSFEKETRDLKLDSDLEELPIFSNKGSCFICGKVTDAKRLVGWIINYVCSNHTDKEIMEKISK
ncbi:MAG: hypothetical protein EAX96_13235 [Candidatus Lokiarchaeota archaeon]|nr:hypothetical protein [Candidatus Lokiarchaeota archaeon]